MADISKFDDISKLQTYEDYIANNITEWEADSIARVCRKIGKIGKMSKKELEKYDANKEAKKEWEQIVAALAIATALNIRALNPQMIKLDKPVKYKKASSCNTIGGIENKKEYYWVDETYPTNVLEFAKVSKPIHPTQKPIALLEYLIKTYTNEGETVLDFTMGSGSTGVACINTKRRFIGIEKDPTYFQIAKNRLENVEIQMKMVL